MLFCKKCNFRTYVFENIADHFLMTGHSEFVLSVLSPENITKKLFFTLSVKKDPEAEKEYKKRKDEFNGITEKNSRE